MINLIVPIDIQERLTLALLNAGTREIGGVLLGEHTDEGVFRIHELTVQPQGGTIVTFVRKIEDSLRQSLRNFFHKTNFEYTRFNYVGEWHSHPSFSLTPSTHDKQSMYEIVNDPNVGANFALLLITKLQQGKLIGKVYLFAPGFEMVTGHLIMEGISK
ncbi:Mov34/MPN/PAD-1 family protein [Paenibacillus piscarius]|uniref:Mov34/MPN/PAD-1 family protein n=1 Tax=Paenibacillus piscarius TaxID=1089681 RepID=UPI001EE7A085|nr:Mov34/MPN/PAD-1 family protein [Paenibacillus piscarius]